MEKTFWAIELELLRVTANVNHNNVSVDDGASTTRESVRTRYVGAFSEAGAQASYDKLDALLRDLPRTE